MEKQEREKNESYNVTEAELRALIREVLTQEALSKKVKKSLDKT